MPIKEFYSHGKLLITGEYVILDGAKGLAIPTKKGQLLKVKEDTLKIVSWKSFDCHNKEWYSVTIPTEAFLKTKAPHGNSEFDTILFKILWQAQQLNPNLFQKQKGYTISTHLEFERLWGLGSSSTLINSIAKWAQINPYKLLRLSFGGSGYDIAAASAESPILFYHTKNVIVPKVESLTFEPLFIERLFFIYLENKKSSKEAIKNYRSLEASNLVSVIQKINAITDAILKCRDLENFEELLDKHEAILSEILKTPTIKSQRFYDYPYSIKSLGGWGGDFVLVTTRNENDLNYFSTKGYTTIIPYTEMVY